MLKKDSRTYMQGKVGFDLAAGVRNLCEAMPRNIIMNNLLIIRNLAKFWLLCLYDTLYIYLFAHFVKEKLLVKIRHNRHHVVV